MSGIVASMGRHTTDSPVGMHLHAEHELIVMLGGSCRISLAGQVHQLDPGSALLIPAGEIHDQHDQENCDNYYLKFSGSPDGLALSPRRLGHDDDLVPRWCADLERVLAQGDQESGDAVLQAICHRLHRQEQVRQRSEALPPPLRAGLAFIDSHYQEAVGSAEIARASGISISHCNLLFRRHCRQTPGGQLLAVRMRHARRLLQDDYRSITEVAALVGLPDANYFCRRFRSEHGQSPRAWRQAQQSPVPG